jgi:hypothetical protein
VVAARKETKALLEGLDLKAIKETKAIRELHHP